MKGAPEYSGMGLELSNWTHAVFDYCSAIAQAALPQQCVLCAAPAGVSRFCAPCAASLPRVPDRRCETCALPLTSGTVCGACLDRPPLYDHAAAAYAYDFPVDALIHAYKYGGDLTLAPVLARALLAVAPHGIDAIVPMPLAHARLRSRGFNQACELARFAARALSLPLLARACRKVTDTPPQAALAWKARAANVRNAFVCDLDLTGRRIAIVDDVMTTGATMNELARNAKRAGASYVCAWVVARTLKESPL